MSNHVKNFFLRWYYGKAFNMLTREELGVCDDWMGLKKLFANVKFYMSSLGELSGTVSSMKGNLTNLGIVLL